MEPLARGGADDEANYMPSCRICNHYKHTLTVEEFREQIGLLTKRLAERVYIYKLALRHGRISQSTGRVLFYFEIAQEPNDPENWIIELCQSHGVEIHFTYDRPRDDLVISMQKENYRIIRRFSAFELTKRPFQSQVELLLCDMADEIDTKFKEEKEKL